MNQLNNISTFEVNAMNRISRAFGMSARYVDLFHFFDNNFTFKMTSITSV